jgi:hypothetical protein
MQVYDLILRRDDTNAKGKRKRCPRKGFFYEVFLDGERISRSQTNAESDACRVLLKRAMTGKARFWREGKAFQDSERDIERAAKVQLLETERKGFRWRRYREFPAARWRTGGAPAASVRSERGGISP